MRLQQESKQQKKSGKEREAEEKNREKANFNSAIEVKTKRKQKNFYAKAKEIKTNALDPVIPSSVVSLLQEFKDVFPDDVPHGLPPIQGIKHHIDFVPGASIPNLPAYRSHLEETKEPQRQVKQYANQANKGWQHVVFDPGD